jgi:hypothetical protein
VVVCFGRSGEVDFFLFFQARINISHFFYFCVCSRTVGTKLVAGFVVSFISQHMLLQTLIGNRAIEQYFSKNLLIKSSTFHFMLLLYFYFYFFSLSNGDPKHHPIIL